MGAAKPNLGGHLCYWMRVDEILDFGAYWNDPRFRRKRPNDWEIYLVDATTFITREWRDEYHRRILSIAFPTASCLFPICARSGRPERVLNSAKVRLPGAIGIKLPQEAKLLRIRGPNHKCRFSDAQLAALLKWIETLDTWLRDEPAHWQFLDQTNQRERAMRGPQILKVAEYDNFVGRTDQYRRPTH